MRTGLFFVRRESTCTTRRISWSRPMTGSSLPSRAAAVKSVPNFSSALYVPSGSGVVTRCPPLTFSNASSSRCAEAPCRSSSSPVWPPLAARPISRCSVETYSSPRSRARSVASASAASSSLFGCGGATVEPCTLGSPARIRSAPERSPAASASTAASRSITFSLSWPASSASSRCAGVRSACPADTARSFAALSASRLLLVSSASTARAPPSSARQLCLD